MLLFGIVSYIALLFFSLFICIYMNMYIALHLLSLILMGLLVIYQLYCVFVGHKRERER